MSGIGGNCWGRLAEDCDNRLVMKSGADFVQDVMALTLEPYEPDRTTSGKRPEPFRYRVIEGHEIPDR